MAITQVYYHLLREACRKKTISKGSSVLELGEANWYGDFSPEVLRSEIRKYVDDQVLQAELERRLDDQKSPTYIFDVAKIIYDLLFCPSKVVSIDFHGTPAALKLDLNMKVDLGEHFDLVINNGTAEHIFNIGQVFKTIHDHTKVEGVMIHEAPFTGWFDHGLFNIQPTLFFDLATANQYNVLGYFCCQHKPPFILQIESPREMLEAVKTNKVPENAVLIVFLKKTTDQDFKYPIQGYYAGTIDEERRESWLKDR